MKPLTVLALSLAFALAGCARQAMLEPANSLPSSETEQARTVNEYTDPAEPTRASFSAGSKKLVPEVMERKIISSAELTLEAQSPLDVRHAVGSIAASAGGFVATSETKQTDASDPQKQQQVSVMLVVRVRSEQFDAALSQIRKAGNRIIREKVTGQDVTEEFIDLEARIKTQKALEQQFLEIMKQSRQVSDAMEVQRQIAEVRTEIEQLEGRQRFLTNRASLATITVTLETPTAIVVKTSSFGRSIKDAVATSLDLGTGIVLGALRLVIVLAPVILFIILPLTLIGRILFNRLRKAQMTRVLSSQTE